MKRSTISALIIVLVIIIAGIIYALANKSNTPNNTNSTYQSNSSSGSRGANNPAPGQVEIRDMMFTPSQITVQKGSTVTWTNNDTTTHTVVDDLSNVGGPHSGNIPPGSNYSFTFNKSGSFQYHCSIHPSMRGTIVVK